MENRESLNFQERLISEEKRIDNFIEALTKRCQQILQDKDATSDALNFVSNVAPLITHDYYSMHLYSR